MALPGALATAWLGTASAQGTGIAYPIQPPVLLPGVRASASYSDNVLLSDSNKKGDMIIEVSPYITAQSNAPRANYSLFYQMRNFWRVDEGETNLMRHAMNGRGSFALYEDNLWLDLAGYMGTVSASSGGPIAYDPGSSFTNTANIRSFSISPWYRNQIGNLASYQLRYTALNTSGSTGLGVANLDQRASAVVNGLGDGSSPWNWGWHGEYQQLRYSNDFNINRRGSGFVLYYRVNPDLRVFGTIDYDQIDGVRNSDGDDFGYGPGAGFDWRPNQRTSLSASVSKRYYGTIGNAQVSYSAQRSTMGLSWSRSVLTSSDASLLFFDPASITSGGLSGFNPVMSNLISSGIVLPAGSALTQGLVTDAAVFDRRLTAFYGLQGASNSLTVSAYYSNRQSAVDFSSTTGISGIRGGITTSGVFDGELRQRGVAVSYQHRIDARSRIDALVNRSTVDSTAQVSDSRITTLLGAYTTELTRDTSVFGGLRRTQQSSGGSGARYDENVVYGGVDMRFR